MDECRYCGEVMPYGVCPQCGKEIEVTKPSPVRKAELEQPCKGITVDWKDRTKQPRCPTCGRFAYWDETIGEWMLGCVVYDYYEGYEHD